MLHNARIMMGKCVQAPQGCCRVCLGTYDVIFTGIDWRADQQHWSIHVTLTSTSPLLLLLPFYICEHEGEQLEVYARTLRP